MGFIFCKDRDFNSELNIRLLYEFNAVCSPSQMIIEKVLTTNEGRKSLTDFKEITTKNITQNINYLREKNLLVDEIYQGAQPLGIFAVINKSEDYLFQHRIGAVGLDKFVYHDKDLWSSYSRICVSVDHELFKKYLINIK